MRKHMKTWCAAAFLLTFPALAGADDGAKLVSVRVIWDQAPLYWGADVARFDDRWFVVYTEKAAAHTNYGAVRVLASADGEQWESVGLLKSRTPQRGVSGPKLSVSSEGKLIVSAVGVVPNLNSSVPVPKYGGTINTLGWFSEDGRNWSTPKRIGHNDFPFSRVVWNDDSAFSYGNGCICGSAQTIQVFSSDDGRHFQSLVKQTFRGFFPGGAAIGFKDDMAYCLMSRNNGSTGTGGWQKGFLGTSEAPYSDWEWKEIDVRIGYPNLIRLPDGRMIAAVGVIDNKLRSLLCELDPASGSLTELLELPTGSRLMPVGLAVHDEHLWACYHAGHDGQLGLRLAKVKVN